MPPRPEQVASALLAALLAFASPALAAPASTSEDFGRSDTLALVRVRPGDTAAAIAERRLGDARQAWRVSPADPARGLEPGALAAVVLPGAEAALPPERAARFVPVLCYHRFSAGRSTSRMEVAAASLDAQLGWLESAGYTVVPLSAVRRFLAGEVELPRGAVAITVDDGFASVHDVAWPVFARHHAPFTAFVISNMIGAHAALDWAKIAEMRRSGLVEFGSHSRDHADLTVRARGEDAGAYERRLQAETEGARRTLAAHTPDGGAFAYPYGAVDARVEEAVRAAGAQTAFTVLRGGNGRGAPPLLLRRDMIYGDWPLETFAAHVRAAAAGSAPSVASDTEEPAS